jgi:hypothetical protein
MALMMGKFPLHSNKMKYVRSTSRSQLMAAIFQNEDGASDNGLWEEKP